MKALYPDQTPPILRKAARLLLPSQIRRRMVAAAWRTAQYFDSTGAAFRNNAAALSALAGTRTGQTCVIIGNGPSLRETDFSRLDGIDSFGLNRITLMREINGFVPTFHVVVNDLVIEQFSDEIALVSSTLFYPWRHRKRLSGRSGATFHFWQSFQDHFSTNAAGGLRVGGTVTNVALQLAYHLGYARVLLVGVDHRFSYEGAPNQELLSGAPDANHFAPAYFGKGVRWNAPDLEQSERDYAMARNAFAAAGRSVIDCTVGGALRIFPRSTLEAELGQGQPSNRPQA